MEARCKACDRAMAATEYYWRSDLDIWEDLCSNCRANVFSIDTIGELLDSLRSDPELYQEED